MRKVKVKDLKYYKIILDSTWCGIRELKEDVSSSIIKYGFAQSFKPVDKDGDIYKCIVPDEKEYNYILCQLSISDVKDIVKEHPEIPFINTEKETIGDMLYMIDLYCDLYEEIDFEDSERFGNWDWCIDPRPPKGSLEERVIIKKKTSLKMNLEVANRILEITGGHWWNNEISKFNSYSKNNIIIKCNEILERYGMKLSEFMDRVRVDEVGNVYWKAKTKYHPLK